MVFLGMLDWRIPRLGQEFADGGHQHHFLAISSPSVLSLGVNDSLVKPVSAGLKEVASSASKLEIT